MTRTILIDPVTRIEGHSKITIMLDDQGQVQDALFHVTQFRGFEKFVEGRPFHEMPSLTARICGICPVSHLMASAKACDQLMAVRIPETAKKLRRIMNLAQNVQSHALSFFYLSAPDLLLGMDSDPVQRHLFGMAQVNPEFARGGVRLRAWGQNVIELLGGKRIHPAWVVPGGVNAPLTAEARDTILKGAPEALNTAKRAIDWLKTIVNNFTEEAAYLANFPTMFMGLVTPDGALEHYDGLLRFIDAHGNTVVDHVPPAHYQDFIGEHTEPYTYLKFPYFKPAGYPNGIYRVGPLARLNIATRCGTPEADAELPFFRRLARGPVMSSFHYHYARLIEIVYGIEKIVELLNSPDILSQHVRAQAGVNNLEGIGISEAPRGTLLHHYKVDEDGLMVSANLIIATGHNNLAMNRGVAQMAKRFVDGNNIKEGALNRVEAVIRAYDPCLSCSTHAIGQMPLHLELVGPDGTVLDEVKR